MSKRDHKKAKTKLPIAGKPTPADAQRELRVTPVTVGSRPEFPTRSELYRKAGLLGGAALLAGGMAAGCATSSPPPPQPPVAVDPAPAPAPAAPSNVASDPAPAPVMPVAPIDPPPLTIDPALLVNGSIDGQPLPPAAPEFKVTRAGGGIGPPEEMWDPAEVDAYLSWQLAHEGKLALKSHVKLSYEGVDVVLDGFDADKNIGYVYSDKMTGDNVTKEVLAKIDAWAKAKKLAILVIDQKRNPDTATLKGKIVKFIAATKRHPPQQGPLDGATIADAAAPAADAK